MTTLLEFLRARLDEDEAAANAWLTPFSNPDTAARDHIARHDPARVLAEVGAKRRIMKLHDILGGSLTGVGRWTYCETCHTNSAGEIDEDVTETTAPCATLRLLALPYDGHPDYDPEWHP